MKCTHCGRKIDKHEHDFDNDGYPVCHICWVVEDECNEKEFSAHNTIDAYCVDSTVGNVNDMLEKDVNVEICD